MNNKALIVIIIFLALLLLYTTFANREPPYNLRARVKLLEYGEQCNIIYLNELLEKTGMTREEIYNKHEEEFQKLFDFYYNQKEEQHGN